MVYWAPLVGWMGLIFALSSLSSAKVEQVSGPLRLLSDLITPSVVHTGEYWALAMLAFRLVWSYRWLTAPAIWIAVMLVAVIYGATDELHQSVVPGRDPSWLDLVYDTLGATIGVALAEIIRRRLSPDG